MLDLEGSGEESMATGVLHDDMLLQILVRLPVKSLLRFRCVSRSWYSLITSSGFISVHVHHNKKVNNYHVLLRKFNRDANKKVWYNLCEDNDALDEIMTIDFPFVSQNNDFFRMVGCVNGLVCLSDDIIEETDTLMLWNPVIRRFLTLPRSKMGVDSTNSGQSVFGFGFDSLNNDYKVIRIHYHKNKDSEDYQDEVSTAVFRLSAGSWEANVNASLPLVDSRQAYAHGVVHWLACNNSIVGFDVRTEEFRQLMFPKSLQNVHVRDLTIAPWCDLLSIFESGYWCGTVSLWVMKDYGVQESWVKQFVVESFAVVRCLRRNGDVILQNNGGKLISYHPKTNQVEDFEIHTDGMLRGFHMKSYMESLVLLDCTNAQLVPQGREESH